MKTWATRGFKGSRATTPRAAQRTTALVRRLNDPRVSIVDERKRLVVQYIRTHGSVTRFDLYELFDTDTKSTVDIPVEHLVLEGVIEYAGLNGGMYHLTAHGDTLYRG